MQVFTESAASHVGRMATSVTSAVRDLTREVGEWASDIFEMREAAAKATDAGKPEARAPSADLE